MSIPLLFLSGAGLADWIWDDARSALPASVPSAVAWAPSPSSASLLDHAQRVLDEVSWPAFTVVAHSIGGVVATALANRDPQRVHSVLGVAAAVPASGTSFLGSLPFPNRLLLSTMMRVAGGRPPEKVIRSGLTGGLTSAAADRVVEDFSPAPQWLYRDSTPERSFPVRRGYLLTSEDREFNARMQAGFADELGATWTRTLPTGHLPMLEAPAEFSMAVAAFMAENKGS